MKSGIIMGQASCIDGMIERIWDELGYQAQVVATGGLHRTLLQEENRL